MKNRIREVRKKHGLTMKQLGEKVGLSESAISQYENGKRQPDNQTLLMFGEIFDVSVDYLLGGEQRSPYLSDRNKKEAATSDCDSLRQEAISLYDSLSRSGQDRALSYLRFLAKNEDKK